MLCRRWCVFVADIRVIAQGMSFDERPKGGGPLAGSALRAAGAAAPT